MSKKISLALATYNGAKFLEELLNSLLAQTLPPDEIVAVDDGSTDDTVKILERFQTKLPIRILQNEKNLGVNLNFQKAVLNCSGDIILICDQDDVWFPENIQTKISMLETLPQNRPALAASMATLVDENLKVISKISRAKNLTDWKALIHTVFQGTTMAFNRRLLDFCTAWPKDFDEIPYDFYLYNVALFTGNVFGGAKSLMNYRAHANNKSFHSGAFKNFVRKWFPLYNQMILYGLSNLNLSGFDFVWSSLPACEIHPEILEYLKFLDECKKSSGFDWLLFARNPHLPFSVKAKVLRRAALEWLKRLGIN